MPPRTNEVSVSTDNKTTAQLHHAQTDKPSPLTTNNTLDQEPTSVIPSHYWRNIDNSRNVQLKLFSAYYDDRDTPEIYLLGFENHEAEQKYYCIFAYDNGKHECVDEPARRKRVNDDVDPFKDYHITFWGFYYICKLPTSSIPVNASLSLHSNCTLNSNRDWLPIDNRVKRETFQMKKFGVCLQGPVYNLKNPQRVVEFVELHKALGAEIITVYIQDAGELVWKILEQYEREGVVDLVNWNLLFIEETGYVHYRGQSLLVNECIYRNMYRVQYLSMNDLDEVIVPQGNLHTWSDMLPAIEGTNRGAFLFQHTTFMHPLSEDSLQCGPERTINQPLYIARTQRFMKGGYEKFIIKPLYSKKASFHRIFEFVGSYYLFNVPKTTGLSYHYREPPLPKQGNTLVDKRLSTLFPTVLENIRERLCSL